MSLIMWCSLLFAIVYGVKFRYNNYYDFVNFQYNKNVSSFYANGRGMVIDEKNKVRDSVSNDESLENINKISKINEKSIYRKALFDEIKSQNIFILTAIIITFVEGSILLGYIKQ